jgi:hypothetical protein
MDYQFLFQTMQQLHAQRMQEPQCFLDRWELHRPAIKWSFKRIKKLAGEYRRHDHHWVKIVLKEINTELSVVRERVLDCETRLQVPRVIVPWED